MMTSDRKYLFVSGNARSGTSLMTRTLNCHPNVCIGGERYARLWSQDVLSPAEFEEERFFDFRDGDASNADDRRRHLEQLSAKRGSIRVIGDKFPNMWRHLDHVFKTFDGARIIHILRNPWGVAKSHQTRFDNPDDRFPLDGRRAIDMWNKSQFYTLRALRDGAAITVVSYEKLFASKANLTRFFDVLGLDIAACDQAKLDKDSERFRQSLTATEPRDEILSAHVASHANLEAYQELVKSFCLFAQPTKEPKPQSNEVFA
jgi:hypothetical protein